LAILSSFQQGEFPIYDVDARIVDLQQLKVAAAEAGHLIVSTRKSKREDQEANDGGARKVRRTTDVRL
jgi:hypothetical protein